MKRRLRWIYGLIAGLVCLVTATDGLADMPEERVEQSSVRGVDQSGVDQIGVDERSIEESMQPRGEDSFAQVFPHGKRSVVSRQLSGTAAVLKAAHKAALRGHEGRKDYRQALIYQAASRRALVAECFALAMYLTLHGRSVAEQVLHANTSRRVPHARAADMERIKRAGGIDANEVDIYLEQAGAGVPGADLLFVDEQLSQSIQ